MKDALKGYRFYAEMPVNRMGKHATKSQAAFTVATLQAMVKQGQHCNVIAVPLQDGRPMWIPGKPVCDAIGAVFNCENSCVAGSVAGRGYLRYRCVRIPRDMVAALHPNMAAYLGVNS